MYCIHLWSTVWQYVYTAVLGEVPVQDENIRLLHLLLSAHTTVSDSEVPALDSSALDEIVFVFLHTKLWNFLKVQVKEKEQLQHANKELLEKSTKLEKELAESSQASEQLQNLTEKLDQQQEDHQSKLEQLTTKHQQVEEELKAAQERIDEIHERNQEGEQANAKLQQQLQESRKKLESRTQASRKYDRERILLQYELGDITQKTNMLQWDLNQCTMERNALEHGWSTNVSY